MAGQEVAELAEAVATGGSRDIAQAVARLVGDAWVAVEGGWQRHPGGPVHTSDEPPAGAVVIEAGGHRIAFTDAGPVVASLVRAGVERLAAQEARLAAESRLDLNERIAGMGSYDWNIVADTNDWSDELYRIYGHEPGAFNASYEKFLSLVHPDDRERIQGIHQQAYGSGEPYEMEEHIVRPDGSVRTLWSNGAVIRNDEGTPVRMVGVCRDITEAREAERQAVEQRDRIRNAELLRQQALELNDNVVQGLSAVVWAIDGGTPLVARSVASETLEHARQMMHELFAASEAPVEAGSLVRATAARMAVDLPAHPSPVAGGEDRLRVVLADDAEDLRTMLRVGLEVEGPVEVVGEAGDGVEAVEVVARTRPDAVLLDLSMPRMDGLQACAAIRASDPDTRIVILSGWGEATMGEQALAAGADAYVQKGAGIAGILETLLGTREYAAG